MFVLHRAFAWYENVWLVAALVNQVYIYGRMFISGEIELEYGHGRAARRAGAQLLPGPFKDDQGFSLLVAFGVLVVLAPLVIGLLNYLLD